MTEKFEWDMYYQFKQKHIAKLRLIVQKTTNIQSYLFSLHFLNKFHYT